MDFPWPSSRVSQKSDLFEILRVLQLLQGSTATRHDLERVESKVDSLNVQVNNGLSNKVQSLEAALGELQEQIRKSDEGRDPHPTVQDRPGEYSLVTLDHRQQELVLRLALSRFWVVFASLVAYLLAAAAGLDAVAVARWLLAHWGNL